MATDTQNTLGTTSVAAEVALYGLPGWTVVGTGTHETVTATAAAVAAIAGKPGKCNHLKKLYLSISGGTPTAGTLTVKDGAAGTTIFQAEIPGAVTAPIPFDFSNAPIRSSAGNALVASIGDLGASIKVTITMVGMTISQM